LFDIKTPGEFALGLSLQEKRQTKVVTVINIVFFILWGDGYCFKPTYL